MELSEKEMRIQKGGHHSDPHLFSFRPSQTGTSVCTRAPTSASGRLNIPINAAIE